jgi:probable addiction module antidote protein
MPKRTRSHDETLREALKSPEEAAEYLNAALELGQDEFLTALGDVARVRGFSGIAEAASKNRESLYRALAEGGNPALDTLLALFQAMHLKLHIEPA